MDDFDHLLYRGGFLLRPARRARLDLPSPLTHWRSLDLRDQELIVDPGVLVTDARSADRRAVLLGRAVNPYTATSDLRTICTRLVEPTSDAARLAALDELTGRFVLLFEDSSASWLVQDAAGTRSVFYAHPPDGLVAASHATLAARVAGTGRDEAAAEIYKAIQSGKGVKYLPGLLSPCEGVLPLTANTRLDLRSGAVERIWPRSARRVRADLDAVSGEAAEVLRSTMALLLAETDAMGSLTAGLDSRLTLAATKEVADRISWFSHISSTAPDPTHVVDLAVAESLATELHLRHRVVEMGDVLREKPGYDDFRAVWLENLGLPRGLPALNFSYLQDWPPGAVHVRSNLVEITRVFYKGDRLDAVDPRSLARRWRARAADHPIALEAFERYMEVTGFSRDSCRGHDPLDVFYWEHRLSLWHSWLCTESDMVHDTFVPFSNRRLLDTLLSLPFEWRRRNLAHTRMIEILWPEVAKIPINPPRWPPLADPSAASKPVGFDIAGWRGRRRRRQAAGVRDKGVNAFKAERYKSAEELLRSAVSLDPEHPWGWLWLARTCHAQGAELEAKRALSRLQSLGADIPGAALLRAQIAAAESAPREAEMWREAVARASDDQAVVKAALKGLMALGDDELVRQVVQTARSTMAAETSSGRIQEAGEDAELFPPRRGELAWTGPTRSDPAPSSRELRSLMLLTKSLPAGGGYTARSHGLVTGMRQAGLEPLVATLPGFRSELDPPMSKVERVDGIDYVRLAGASRIGPEGIRTAAAAAIQALGDHQPQVVHAASFAFNGLVATEVGRRLGLPVVYEVRGLYHLSRASRTPGWDRSVLGELHQATEVVACEAADLVVTLTSQMREELVRLGVERHRIELLPNSVDPDRFRPAPRDAELAAELGIEDKVVIGYLGSHARYEGLIHLVEAIALLRDRGLGDQIVVLMAGAGTTLERVKRSIADHGLQDIVHHLGQVPHDEVPRLLSLIDIVPLPRLPEWVCEVVSPMKPFESMAMEKALVVSSVGALQDIVDHRRTGLVFDKGDVSSLADALHELVEDDDLRARLGAAAREWVRSERTWAVQGERLGRWHAALASGLRPGGRGWPEG